MGDVICAARVLLGVPRRRWAWVLARMCAEARASGGSLMEAALRRETVAEPDLRCREYRRALVFVLLGLGRD
ncbi:hypothetical protein [Tranquillimonas alkanivorans]|uniref:Uncharacterized protein n=1 Tax=Tranquillimonas alkanivorans TaxID=441119 RepID=A0A1I5QQQ8_9RHOB|nr:hypothetical protein [Tranquillimonas alkanivorans]SFP48658.1 hypothetical protein SAMN04488047_10767 [Tranquillimonas alkanivorans]